MRITFIEPSPPGFHIYSFVKQVRIGLPLMATMLRDRGHDVRVCAEALGDIDWNRVLSSDLVGISTTTSTVIKAYRYAEKAREAGIPVAMGGPHVTFQAEEAMEYCDFVVRGEGEEAIMELADYLRGRRTLDSILGLTYRAKDGTVVNNPARPLRATLTDLPWPDYSLVDHQEKIFPLPLLTSRGCPHDCEFCSVVMMFGRKYRRVSPESVVEEIKKLRPKQIFFYDDNFIITKKSAKKLLAQMIRQDVSTRFSAQIRVDSVCKAGRVDHELLKLLKEAGCTMVYLGLESVNPETLALYNKRQGVEDIRGGLAALHSYGIDTHGMFVFGADTDTRESMKATVDFTIENGISSVQFLALTPLVGTRTFEQLEREGRLFTRNWSLYDGHHVVFRPKQMSPWELQEAVMEAHLRFYNLTRATSHTRWRLSGFLLANAWLRAPENVAYMKELRTYSEGLARLGIPGV